MGCNPRNCTGWPDNCPPAQPDPDIAGIGVILSFVLTSAITLVASVTVHNLRPKSYEKDLYPPPNPSTHKTLDILISRSVRNAQLPSSVSASDNSQAKSTKQKWIDILDQLILSLSDQQLATSIAILVTTFIRQCEISNFHLNVVSDIAWFSTITHLLSMVVLRVHWIEDTRRRVLHIRLFLMICVVIMLTFTLIWSPQYEPTAGTGACPAHCAFSNSDASTLFSEYEFPIQHTPLNFAGMVQSFLLAWGYSTTGFFVAPFWYRFYRFWLWILPGHVFRGSKLCCLWVVNQIWKQGRLYNLVEKLFDGLKIFWKVIFFPLPRTAIGVQVVSWCFGLAFLILDRWGSHESVANPQEENQWGFGQLLAMIIVVLPILPLMEIWSDVNSQSREASQDTDGQPGVVQPSSAVMELQLTSPAGDGNSALNLRGEEPLPSSVRAVLDRPQPPS